MKSTIKYLFLTISLALVADYALAQRFYSVVFDNLPRDMQLYAREDDNTAEVPISGFIEAAGWDHMSVVTFRNEKPISYDKSALTYTSANRATFSLKPAIKAEMADYSFAVYVCREADSILVVKRENIVAGDFYVISGQSNAAASHFGNWSSKYARTIARVPDEDPSITVADTNWILSSWSWPYAGAWGVEMQRRILEQDSIPTCVINGALPGSKIAFHLDRNADNPASPTLYGMLYRRIKVAKPKRIRAFFWYQGEQEALEDIKNYDQEYDKLHKYWETDYPQVEKYIVVQIPVLFNPFYEAGKIREFQRKTKYIYPNTEHFNVSGLPGFDGIHYSLSGYYELGRRFHRFIRPMFYGSADSSNVACPDVQKVFYSNEQKTEITLLYEPGQSLVWPKDTLLNGQDGNKFTMGLKDVYFFDSDESKPAGIASGTASGNRVTLKLNAASQAKKLTYLPAYKGERINIYYGPFLKNRRELAAFSFQDLDIADLLPVALEAKESERVSINVNWQSAGAETFTLERKGPDDKDFIKVEDFDGKATSYEDEDVSPDQTYSYRLQAFSKTSQSIVKTATVKMLPLLAVRPSESEMFWKVYPNPVSKWLNVEFRNIVKGNAGLFTISGKQVKVQILKAEHTLKIDVSDLPAGIYILSVNQEDGKVMSQKIVKP